MYFRSDVDVSKSDSFFRRSHDEETEDHLEVKT